MEESKVRQFNGGAALSRVDDLISSANRRNDRLTKLACLGSVLVEIDDVISDLEDQLAEAKALRAKLSGKDLVEIMDDADVERIKLRSGRDLVLRSSVKANLSKDRAPAGVQWLFGNGHQGIVKPRLIVPFDKMKKLDPLEKARKDIEGLSLTVVDGSEVHPKTLSKWATEMVEAGKDFPQDLFGVYIRRTAEVLDK